MTNRNNLRCERSWLTLSHSTQDPVSELHGFIRRCTLSSFDSWTTNAFLHMKDQIITRPFLESMIEFVNLPLAKDPCGAGYEKFPWIEVSMQSCKFAQPNTIQADLDNKDFCTIDDKQRLFHVITRRVLALIIFESPEIVSGFLSTPLQFGCFNAEELVIQQKEGLSARQYANLGRMIQWSATLRELCLEIPFVAGSQNLFAGLANAVNLHEIHLRDYSWSWVQRNVVVGDNGGNGPIMQLLRNPGNQLKQLCLENMRLKDHHLIWILQTLPTSQIGMLRFPRNFIQLQGMLAFANLLPQMPSLQLADFMLNAWQDSSTDSNKVGEALLQGMMENTSIVDLYDIERLSQYPQLYYYVVLNRAGRQILRSSKPIPCGLWPLVLERAGKMRDWTLHGWPRPPHNGRASAVDYFLHSCPSILAFR